MTPEDVVLTGVGVVLPAAATPADLLAGPRTIKPRPVDPAILIGRRGLRYKDRATQLALAGAHEALRAAGLLDGADHTTGGLTVDSASFGVVVSSNLGNLDTVCEVTSTIGQSSVDGASPMDLPNASSNVVASSIAIRFGLRGPNLMLCNGPTSGLDAVYWAARLIAGRRSDRVLVVGVETSNAVVRHLMGMDGEDSGELLDGAVGVVVERGHLARERGAPVLATVGPYARAQTVASCVETLLSRSPGADPPGVWFVPEGNVGAELEAAEVEAMVGARLASARHADLTEACGRSSGALGVIQCAAAAGWFEAGNTSPALLTAGRDVDDATSALLVLPSGRP